MRVPSLLACLSLLAVPVASAQVGASSGILNPNLVGKEQLAELPHLSAELAQSIVDGRPFLGMSALHALLSKSLTSEQIAELYPRLFLPIDLNRASTEEILLVPGVGKRMAHEFEEYRPYKALAQFRREMGKYVDDDEVARLERFVFIPLDLNVASAEHLATIPGVGPRMVREFLEYRPYQSLAQFRREIGKYVDDQEVARLERYFVLTPTEPGAQAPAEATAPVSAGPLNPNLVGQEALTSLPHLTDEHVKAILAGRPFLSMSELHAVIGGALEPQQRTELYARMFIPLNLNDASREEILLVPGVGKRMAHEFEEYRPYKSMKQFEREMGKYVDDAEVARLVLFVFVPLDLNSASAEEFATLPGVGPRMVKEFLEYRPYKDMAQFRREIGKYVDDKELARLERYVCIR